MIAIEIEAPIVDHRLDIRSLLLPANADRAKVIVMFEETPARLPGADVLALARAAQASFPRQSSESLAQAMKEMRDEVEPRSVNGARWLLDSECRTSD